MLRVFAHKILSEVFYAVEVNESGYTESGIHSGVVQIDQRLSKYKIGRFRCVNVGHTKYFVELIDDNGEATTSHETSNGRLAYELIDGAQSKDTDS